MGRWRVVSRRSFRVNVLILPYTWGLIFMGKKLWSKNVFTVGIELCSEKFHFESYRKKNNHYIGFLSQCSNPNIGRFHKKNAMSKSLRVHSIPQWSLKNKVISRRTNSQGIIWFKLSEIFRPPWILKIGKGKTKSHPFRLLLKTNNQNCSMYHTIVHRNVKFFPLWKSLKKYSWWLLVGNMFLLYARNHTILKKIVLWFTSITNF